jgi:hypothetical protein
MWPANLNLPSPAAPSSGERTYGAPILGIFLLVVIVLAALLNALPHLHESLWQDEVSTLEFHASHGIVHPLLHYGSPNNHIAFSAMLAAWLELVPSAEPAWLRILPLAFFLLTIPVVFLAARRMGDAAAAGIATLMFASSSISGNFATQLRGYAPSWLFMALALLCALRATADRRNWHWHSGYCLSVLMAVWILPTNVFLCAATGACVGVYGMLDPKQRDAAGLRTAAMLFLAPFLGLGMAYAAVWQELVRYKAMVASSWTRVGLLQHWWHASVSDYRWLLPVACAALLLALKRILRRTVPSRIEGNRELALALMLVLGLAVTVAVMPSTPFPRTLVPYLPVWFCAMGYLVARMFRVFPRTPMAALGIVLLVALGLGLSGANPTPVCRNERGSGGASDYDLCHQYFRDEYHPDRVIELWASVGRADVPIATDFEGYYSLRALGSRATIFEYRFPPRGRMTTPLVVAHDAGEMLRMVHALGLQSHRYRIAADTGYFKVYAPSR